MSFDDEKGIFRAVVNDEGQYAIWPDFRPVPAGWREVGVTGDKATCLAHIETVWTDMRPRSLREHLAAQGDARDGV